MVVTRTIQLRGSYSSFTILLFQWIYFLTDDTKILKAFPQIIMLLFASPLPPSSKSAWKIRWQNIFLIWNFQWNFKYNQLHKIKLKYIPLRMKQLLSILSMFELVQQNVERNWIFDVQNRKKFFLAFFCRILVISYFFKLMDAFSNGLLNLRNINESVKTFFFWVFFSNLMPRNSKFAKKK